TGGSGWCSHCDGGPSTGSTSASSTGSDSDTGAVSDVGYIVYCISDTAESGDGSSRPSVLDISANLLPTERPPQARGAAFTVPDPQAAARRGVDGYAGSGAGCAA